MDDQPTCGKGLADRAALPGSLARLMAAMAAILETHQNALVLEDPNARLEYDAYVKLARAYRDIAGKLQRTADQMTRYRDLPMAKHDERAMMSLDACESFDRFVTVERELLGYLTTALKGDEAMLEQMRSLCR